MVGTIWFRPLYHHRLHVLHSNSFLLFATSIAQLYSPNMRMRGVSHNNLEKKWRTINQENTPFYLLLLRHVQIYSEYLPRDLANRPPNYEVGSSRLGDLSLWQSPKRSLEVNQGGPHEGLVTCFLTLHLNHGKDDERRLWSDSWMGWVVPRMTGH